MPLYGAVEGGGTKFLCAVATAPEPSAIVDQVRVDTRDAEATLADVARFFRQRGRLAGLGVASFGPVELDPTSPAYGHILPTPKPGWSGASILPRLCAELGLDLARARIETDVNAAALG